MEIDSFKWSFPSIFIPHQKHTDNPKEENIISCFKNICRIIFFKEFSWVIKVPVENRKRPKSAGKPSIENIFISNNIFLPIFRIKFFRICCYSEEFFCFAVIVCRNLMSPPELARYTPVTQVINPVFKCFIKALRKDSKFSFFIP